MTVAPFGSWSSPITAASLTSESVGLAAPALLAGDLYWLETRADQGGRASLWCQDRNGVQREVTPHHYVRTRVHEYGGGEYGVDLGVIVFSSFPDGRLFVVRDGAEPVPLTAGEPFRFADLRVHAELNFVLAVREDHSGDGEAVNTVVALRLDGPEDQTGAVLCAGADFYSSPELSDDGRLAWTQWNHPSMPWDSTAIMVGRLEGATVADMSQVAGGPEESATRPRWAGEELIFVSDRSGWANLYGWLRGALRHLRPAEEEFARPQWVFGDNPYAIVDSDHLLCSASRGGESVLGSLTMSSGDWAPLPIGGDASGLVVEGERAAALVSYRDRPSELVVVDLPSERVEAIRASSATRLDRRLVSPARLLSWSGPDGEVYGWFYPPTNPGFSGPQGSAPPLLTVCHGGPTGFSAPSFKASTQYWTSRGLAVLEVNYGGSAGYGRAYRERLKGAWGLVDVRDCAGGALAAADQGLADPARLVIMGGSAGGYTALRALTTTHATFAAAISLYGVGDLEALARDTHKFESRYLDGLIGPYPAARDLYVERSPISHVDRLSAPILLLQGTEDKVVPPAQSAAMAAAARAKGLPVALVMFDGEGHGLRRAESIQASYEAQLYFLGRILRFVPADVLPGIRIENEPIQPGQ